MRNEVEGCSADDAEKRIWLAAYLRGLAVSAPEDAAEAAEYAIGLYEQRWAEKPTMTPDEAAREAAFQAAARRASEIMDRQIR